MISVTFALPVRSLLAAALLICAAHPLPAQQDSSLRQTPQNPESSDVVFRSDVRRVILDVVVTDSNEKPVRGLSREDFSVKEDGKIQPVLSFDAHDFDEVPNPLPKLPSLPSNSWVNVPPVPERGPLYVILYDMLNMAMDDQATARKQLLKFISDKPPGSRFAIFVLSDGLRLVQGFTADQSQLFAAMDPSSPRPHVPKIFLYGDNYGAGQVGPIVAVFTEIAHFLEGLPERKNVIWVTGSIPSTILPTGNTEAASYDSEIKEAIDAMARSQVAVYPVDVRGVVVTHIQARSQAGGGGGSAMTTTNDSAPLNASYATEGDIAIATGGHAFYSTNDLKAALAEATEAGANYYTLSYAPSNHNFDGQLRKIHVELSKHGYHLAYRRSYYADPTDFVAQHDNIPATEPPPQLPPDKPGDSLNAHMRHGAPLMHQLFFGAHVHVVGAPAMATPEQMLILAKQQSHFRAGGKNRPAKSLPPVPLQAYAIDYTLSARQLKLESQARGRQTLLLEIAAAVFDADGQVLNSRIERTRDAFFPSPSNAGEAIASAPVEPVPAHFLQLQQQIDAPLNAASIRIAVRDVTTNRVGAMEVALPLAPEPLAQAGAPETSPMDSVSANQN